MLKYSFTLFFVSMTALGATNNQLIDTSNSLLDLVITQSETVFIPRLFQPDINSLLDGLEEASLVDYLAIADTSEYDYLINAGAAVLVDTLTQSELDHPTDKLAEWQTELSAYVMDFIDKFITLRQNGITQEWSIADFVNAFGVPVEYLGNIALLLFQNKNLTSLFGLQNISNEDVYALIFYNNYLFGPPRDVQFPSDPFGSNFHTILVVALYDNPTFKNLPSDIFQNRTEVKELYLGNMGLHSFSDTLFSHLHELRTLQLSENNLPEISHEQIKDLYRLEKLALDINTFGTLPDDLFNGISFIEALSMQDCSLIAWPVSLVDGLIDLEELYLNNNQLDAFDAHQLPDGLYIDLQGNNITQSQVEVLEEKFPDVTFDI